MNTYIRWLEEVGQDDRPEVGGKGAGLGELAPAGVKVPVGFVVTTGAFERFLTSVERDEPMRERMAVLEPQDLESIRAESDAVRRRFEGTPLPGDVLEEILRAHTRLCAEDANAAVAVRSSATAEDTTQASFTGLQDTFLWVRDPTDMIARIRSCWASLYSPEAVSYRPKHGFAEAGAAMTVVVQRMVDARTAGVMFTRSPTTGDRSVIVIEAAWGLGSAVVGGGVTPDHWVINKVALDLPFHTISDKAIQHVPAPGGGIQRVPVAEDLRHAPSLSDAELRALTAIGRKVERHYGRPQDIEWAIDWKGKDGKGIFLLQCRPETVWSSKDQIAIARFAKNPLTHVMTIFGGRLGARGEGPVSERERGE
ncbi:MAG TPA: PEP/pyruvate-binding domain-containing protein [Steroidobacteraceae bacterium]|nr:PEP/pyruvate-binding domain-containing protein [Steroidobacteraceae bacterium]